MRKWTRATLWSGLLLALVALPAPAAAKEGFHGYISAFGNADTGRGTARSDVEAELRYESPRFHDFTAHIAIEGRFFKGTLGLEDAWMDYRIRKQRHLSLGLSKKILGLEYAEGRFERLTIHRSPLYQKLADLGMVGRQLNLRYTHGPQKRDGNGFSAALGADGNRDYNLILSGHHRHALWGAAMWGLLESRKIGHHRMWVYGESAALWFTPHRHRLRLEVFHGRDQPRSEFAKLFGGAQHVMYLGIKGEAATAFVPVSALRIEPFFQTAFWYDDLRDPAHNTLHFTLGSRVVYRRLKFSLNLETQGDQRGTTARRHYNHKGVALEVLLAF
ncbi:MAG: hypothetical protein M0R76_02230 [Proteobacteria bacterium]|nr:hypothetical protein [Pseudomonadota bacterium]